MLYLIVLSIFLPIFFPPIKCTSEAHAGSFTNKSRGREGEGVGAPDYSTHLTHISALFMTSLLKAAGHKMAALTVVFWRLSDVDLLANRTINRTKKDLFIFN